VSLITKTKLGLSRWGRRGEEGATLAIGVHGG
jgi:hypothetical protein